jgi:hypothetical protein
MTVPAGMGPVRERGVNGGARLGCGSGGAGSGVIEALGALCAAAFRLWRGRGPA